MKSPALASLPTGSVWCIIAGSLQAHSPPAQGRWGLRSARRPHFSGMSQKMRLSVCPLWPSTSLVKFRNRLLEGEAERVGFDALLSALSSSGLVRRNGKQRLDSTHVLGAVAKMSRLEMVRESIRADIRGGSGCAESAGAPAPPKILPRYPKTGGCSAESRFQV